MATDQQDEAPRTMDKGQATSVLIIIENLTVPVDRRVWQEARTLHEAGYRVSVLCPKQGKFRASHETREGIEIFRYPLREGSGPLSYILEYLWAFVAQLGLRSEEHTSELQSHSF